MHLLHQLVILFGVSVVAIYLAHRLGVPSIAGLLLTGIIIGPNGLALVTSHEEISLFAEMGIVLLLFTIGTEFSLRHFLKIKWSVIIGGATQVGLTAGTTALIALGAGAADSQAFVYGFLAALSSTALVLSLMRRSGDVDSATGRATFSILLFQDLMIVPVMLVVPTLAESDVPGPVVSAWWPIFRGCLILALVLLSAKWLVPRLLRFLMGTGDRELFLVGVILICLTVAFLTQQAGLSLSLGALLAGLIVSETEHSHAALSNVLPFQQVFVILFFVSIGMLLNLPFALEHASTVAGLTLLVVVGKILLAIPAGLALRLSLRDTLLSAFALAQIGEFSFILAGSAVEHRILSDDAYQTVLSVSVLTLLVAPLLIQGAPWLIGRITRSQAPS